MDDLPIGWTKETRKYAGGFVKDTLPSVPKENIDESRAGGFVNDFNNGAGSDGPAIEGKLPEILFGSIGPTASFVDGKLPKIYSGSQGPTASFVEGKLSEISFGSHEPTASFVEGKLPEISFGFLEPTASFVEGKPPEISSGLDSNTNLGSSKRKPIDLLPHPTSKKLDLAGVEPHDGMPSLAGLRENRNEANPHSLLEIMSGPSYHLAIRTLKGEIPMEYPTPLEPLPKPRAAVPVPKTHAFTPYNVSPNIDHVPNTNSLDQLSSESAMYRAYTQKRPLPYSIDQNMYRPRVKMPSPSVVVPNIQLANKSVNDLSSSAMPLYECDGINVGNMAQNSNVSRKNDMDSEAYKYNRRIFPEGAINNMMSILGDNMSLSDFDQFMMMSSSSSQSSSCFSTVVAAVDGYGPGGGRNDPDDSQHPSSSGSTPTESKKPSGNN